MTCRPIACVLALIASPLLAQSTGPARVQPLAPEVTLAVGKTNDHQLVVPKAVVLAQHEFLVTWDLSYTAYSGSNLIDWGSQISGRKVSLEGQPVGPVLNLVAFEQKSDQSLHGLAADASGGFAVLWHELEPPIRLLLRRFAPDGSRLDTKRLDGGKLPLTVGSGVGPRLAIDPSGALAAVWQPVDSLEGMSRPRMQLFDSGGNPRGGSFEIPRVRGETPAVAMAEGNVILAYTRQREAPLLPALVVQRFDAAGRLLGREIPIIGGHARPAIAANAEGRFVVVADNNRQISAQRFDASGKRVGPVLRVDTQSGLNENFAHVAIDSSGSFVVVWEARVNSESPLEVRARLFDRDGVPQGDDFVVASDLQVYFNPISAVAMTEAGTFLVAWESATLDDLRPRIKARLFGVQSGDDR